MTTIQWLLIGGPAHGKLLHVKGGAQVRYPHSDGEDYLYHGRNELWNGDLYRVGVCTSEGGDAIAPSQIYALIESTCLKPLPDRVA